MRQMAQQYLPEELDSGQRNTGVARHALPPRVSGQSPAGGVLLRVRPSQRNRPAAKEGKTLSLLN